MPTNRHGRLAALLLVAGCAALAALPAGASASRRGAPHRFVGPKHRLSTSTSTNWSGYAIDGTDANNVAGTWTQPTASCSPGENSWSSPWVGIDGDNSNTVEQIGTDSDCVNGTPTYYAWYEMYPKGLVKLSSPAVVPGHSYTGAVTFSAGSFSMTLTDNTTATTTGTPSLSRNNAHRSSVEWIMEGPSNGLLTNFGSVPFSNMSSNLGTAATSITMVTSSGATRALPGPLRNNAFSVAWQHS